MDAIKAIENATAPISLTDKIYIMLTYLGEKPASIIALFGEELNYTEQDGFDIQTLEINEDGLRTFRKLLDQLKLPYMSYERFIHNYEYTFATITLPPNNCTKGFRLLCEKDDLQARIELYNDPLILTTKLKCPVYYLNNNRTTHKIEILDFLIANNKRKLIDIIHARDIWDEGRLGLSLGYPKTAVEAYLGIIKREENQSLMDKKKSLKKIRRNPGSTDELYYGIPRELSFFMQWVQSEDYFEEELETAWKWHDCIKENSPKLYSQITHYTNLMHYD